VKICNLIGIQRKDQNTTSGGEWKRKLFFLKNDPVTRHRKRLDVQVRYFIQRIALVNWKSKRTVTLTIPGISRCHTNTEFLSSEDSCNSKSVPREHQRSLLQLPWQHTSCGLISFTAKRARCGCHGSFESNHT